MVQIAVLPFYHIYGLLMLLHLPLHLNIPMVILPSFQPQLFASAVREHKVSMAAIVPPIAQYLARRSQEHRDDLSSLEIVLSGAAPFNVETARKLESQLACRVIQGYGCTETSQSLSTLNPEYEFRSGRPGGDILISGSIKAVYGLNRQSDPQYSGKASGA